MKDDRRELNKQIESVLWIGLGIFAVHIYIELHTFFANLGYAHPKSDAILGRMVNNSKNLFGSHWTMKMIAGACIVAYGIGNRGVKSTTLTAASVARSLGIGVILYVGSTFMLSSNWLLGKTSVSYLSIAYMVISIGGLLYLLKGAQGINRLLGFTPGGDEFNSENETFLQEERKIENEFSINLPTKYFYKGKERYGWINIANPFRGSMILGTPGSGKSFAFMNSIIEQHISKGFSVYLYDWKSPDLSLVAFNSMVHNRKRLPENTRFYCINLSDPQKSHRCNPLDPIYLPQIDDAYESAKIMMLNMNKQWIGKEGDIWADSAINYTTALLWFLRTYKKGIYCTFPHLVEMMTIDYRKIFPVLMAHPDLEAYMTLFVSAYNGGAMEMLEGQVGTARSGLAKLSSPGIYWAMSANDFTLDINNPDQPKILCVANNPKKKNLYSAAVGLFNARVLNLINMPNQHPCSVVIDELPTIYFQGLSDLIATGRGNKIAVTLSMQDFSQAEREYGKPEAEVIRNTVGTVISGAVSGQTAKAMEERLGKNVQKKHSINIQSEDTTHGISTELQPMAPAAKIGQLKAGHFVGVVAGSYGDEGNLKAFNAEVIIDTTGYKQRQKAKELPDFSIFAKEGPSIDEVVRENYDRIKSETKKIIDDEIDRLNIELNDTPPKPKKRK
ncbi:conjugal transfer protein MobC [Spirosoma horti]